MGPISRMEKLRPAKGCGFPRSHSRSAREQSRPDPTPLIMASLTLKDGF